MEKLQLFDLPVFFRELQEYYDKSREEFWDTPIYPVYTVLNTMNNDQFSSLAYHTIGQIPCDQNMQERYVKRFVEAELVEETLKRILEIHHNYERTNREIATV